MGLDYKFLKWDSDLFGYKVARIIATNNNVNEFNDAINEIKKNNMKLVYVFIKPDDIISNESVLNFKPILADKKITFNKNLFNKNEYRIDDNIKFYQNTEPSQKLVKLAFQSGQYSRFNTDKNFKNNEFEKLYTIWIKNSLNKTIANETLVYHEEKSELGFITIKFQNSSSAIGLIAVDEHARGKSIGRKLVSAISNRVTSNNINEIKVSTQLLNNEACCFYKKIGFEEESIINIYHIWL